MEGAGGGVGDTAVNVAEDEGREGIGEESDGFDEED